MSLRQERKAQMEEKFVDLSLCVAAIFHEARRAFTLAQETMPPDSAAYQLIQAQAVAAKNAKDQLRAMAKAEGWSDERIAITFGSDHSMTHGVR